MSALTSETRYILLCAPSPLSGGGQPFATAEFTNEQEGNLLSHKLCFHDYRRDVPADAFLEMINAYDLSRALAAPGARTLRGLVNVKEDAKYGIDPGLLFSWPRERVRARAGGEQPDESVFLSVPLI